MAIADNEMLTFDEFETVAKHQGIPRQPRVSTSKLILVSIMFILGAASVVAGVAIIYWPAALIVGGLMVIALVRFVDLSTPEPPRS